MSKEKANDLSSIAWLNLVLGLYNIYLFTVGHLLFNFIIGSLNVGVWVFFRKPETLRSVIGNDIGKKKNN